MNRSITGLRSAFAAVLMCVFLLSAVSGAGAAEAVHYTSESLAEFEQQLSAGQLHSAVFNRKLRSIRLTLKDGSHALVHYPPRGAPPIEAKLAAKHVSVTILSPTLANKEFKEKPKHHKIRYIVGGVLLVVIVVVGGVLLVNRRRQRD